MASTNTFTATKTFTRMNLLKMQIRIALRNTSDIAYESLNNIVNQGIEKKYLKKINVYGIDEEKYCRAQMSMEIDWDEHNLQMSKGKVTVAVDKKWKDDTAVEVDEVVQLFNDIVEYWSLKTQVHYVYSPNVDTEKVNKELGLSSAENIQWKTATKDETSKKIPKLSELKVGIRLAADGDETDSG